MSYKRGVRAGKACEGDLQTQARRLFRYLAEPGAFIRQVSTGDRQVWSAFSGANGFRRPQMQVSAELVAKLLDRSWLKGHADGSLSASQTGLNWYQSARQTSAGFDLRHRMVAEREIELPDGTKATARVNEGESPLSWLRNRRNSSGAALLSAVQFEAGERFRADFERARLMPKITADWSMPIGSRRSRRSGKPADPLDRSAAALAARQRVYDAIDAVGPDLTGILIELCCNLTGLENAERLLDLPQRSGKIVLQIALNHLARHYRLLGAPVRRSHGAMRHWGADDYRPSIDGE